ALATRMLAETYVRVEGAFPLIGVGGIDSGQAAVAKIRAGASLIELYSALVFHGLRLVAAIKSELSEALRRVGQARIDELVGADAAAMTAGKWPAKRAVSPLRPCSPEVAEIRATRKCNSWPWPTRMRRTTNQIGTTTAAPRRR